MQLDVSLNINLHANQRIIHQNKAKFKVVKAGKRFGKTKWALFEVCQAAGRNPNSVYWYVAPTYRMAKQIAWWDLNTMLPRQIVRRSIEGDLYKELTNGARIQLIGADNEDSLRGPRLNGYIIDEAAYVKEYAHSGILSSQILGVPGAFAYFISSPNWAGPNWFTNFHAEAQRYEQTGDPDWAAFHFTIYDNPTIPKEEIEKERARKPDDVWNIEFMALESDRAGQLYSEFSQERNIGEYKAQETRPLPIFRAIDWGLDHPTVCLFAYLDMAAKVVYVFDEFVKSGCLISESAQQILARTGNAPVELTVIDPSTSKRNSQTPYTDAHEFARYGIPCVPGDNRSRGVDIVKMFLKNGMLKIHPKCKNLIYQLRNLQWGEDIGDDCTDALRYLLVRIHDRIGGMNIFDEGATFDRSKLKPNECNFNDPLLFPAKEKLSIPEFIMEEVA